MLDLFNEPVLKKETKTGLINTINNRTQGTSNKKLNKKHKTNKQSNKATQTYTN